MRTDICPRTLSVARGEPVSFEEQRKHPIFFSRQMEATAFIILHIIFRNTRSFEN